MKIKNRPDKSFDDNMIVNNKDFDTSLLKTNKLSFKGVFSLDIYYIKYITTKSPNRRIKDRIDNDEDYLCLFLHEVDGYIEENNEIKYLVFTPTEKKQRSTRKILFFT